MSQTGHGRTLLQVKPSGFTQWFPILGGPALLLGGMAAIFAPGSRGVGLMMLLFGAGFTAMGIRGSWQKAVLIEVTDGGIQFHANVNGICVCFSLLRDLFIPWERLEAIRFLTLQQVIAEGIILAVGRGPVTPGCIAFKLKMDMFWPPMGTLREGIVMRRAKPGEIYICTSNCSPGGRMLWKQLTEIISRWSNSHGVVEPEPRKGDNR